MRYSESKIRKAELLLVSGSLCIIQILPVLALTFIKNRVWKLLFVAILIILVSLLNTIFANSARSANFGAVAAFVTSSLAILQKLTLSVVQLLRNYSCVPRTEQLSLTTALGSAGLLKSHLESGGSHLKTSIYLQKSTLNK